MTYRQTETSKEIRLWISQVIVPASVAVITLMANPDTKNAIMSKASEIKQTIKTKLKKN